MQDTTTGTEKRQPPLEHVIDRGEACAALQNQPKQNLDVSKYFALKNIKENLKDNSLALSTAV